MTQQRTWFITGVNSGFGRSMTEQLLARGDRVAGTARDLSAMTELKTRYADLLWLAELDVTDSAAIRRVVDQAFQQLGRIEVLVSNAGYGLFGAAEEISDEQLVHQMDTNLIGSMQLVRAVLPHFRRQQAGRILQLSSVGGQAAFPGASAYHASKWGIEGFIDAVGQEVATFNIGCTLVEPGGARTAFRYGSSQLAPRIEAYDTSPASMARRMIEEGTSIPIGDPAKMTALMIASVDQHPAPQRLALGSDAYATMHRQLSARLAALEAQKELALSTDFAADS
ncbi:SDR family oxidoreductase [Duganella aceris]|uniref:SDR family oxidoreductase n=1 Tax=Duganella aceris TaxID=2703883 RepID=A0ABX0FVX7_9BURK|nr:SDR family oxidoreductase [Duganella aceris]NGZ88532.1 SDR family oxidoreductase [Duganella aceris]